jgi:hypothetical protein
MHRIFSVSLEVFHILKLDSLKESYVKNYNFQWYCFSSLLPVSKENPTTIAANVNTPVSKRDSFIQTWKKKS